LHANNYLVGLICGQSIGFSARKGSSLEDLNIESSVLLEDPAQKLQDGEDDNTDSEHEIKFPDDEEVVANEVNDGQVIDEDVINIKTDHENDLPSGVKARIGRQEKRHQREMRALEEEIVRMKSAMSAERSPHQFAHHEVSDVSIPSINPYTGLPINEDTIEGIVQKQMFAHEFAKQRLEKQKIAERENLELSELQKDYFKSVAEASDKYDDFEEVVGRSVNKITNEMQMAAQFISNPGDILYSLSKNTAELDRINKLPKFKQMKEVVRYAEAFNSRVIAKKLSKAPSPVSQSNSSGKSILSDPSKLSYAEISRRERERNKRN
jgi:hypothetical protein